MKLATRRSLICLASLGAIALANAGCRCRDGTLYLYLTYDALVAQADQVELSLSLGGVRRPSSRQPLTRSGDLIEVDFASGYPASGSMMSVDVTAFRGGIPAGRGHATARLASGCTAIEIAVAGAPFDAGTVTPGGDAATPADLAMVTPTDGSPSDLVSVAADDRAPAPPFDLAAMPPPDLVPPLPPDFTTTTSCTGMVCAPGTNKVCGNCGYAYCTASCVWDKCRGEGACAPGMTRSMPCGKCGTEIDTCGNDCQWAAGACNNEGGCVPSSTRAMACGKCGSEIDTCSAQCQWIAGSCMNEGECLPQATQQKACGNCGTETDTCSAGCKWIPGACGQGACTPGAQRTADCGNCGTRTEVCGANCTWTLGGCNNQGVCAPNSTQKVACGYCNLGTVTDTCGANCQWIKGTCQQNGCAPTATRVVACGNCGMETDTCSATTCQWVPGACVGSGCVPGSKDTQCCPKLCQHGCDTFGASTCSATCQWGACVGATCSSGCGADCCGKCCDGCCGGHPCL